VAASADNGESREKEGRGRNSQEGPRGAGSNRNSSRRGPSLATKSVPIPLVSQSAGKRRDDIEPCGAVATGASGAPCAKHLSHAPAGVTRLGRDPRNRSSVLPPSGAERGSVVRPHMGLHDSTRSRSRGAPIHDPEPRPLVPFERTLDCGAEAATGRQRLHADRCAYSTDVRAAIEISRQIPASTFCTFR
jgi:hypothetical protein